MDGGPEVPDAGHHPPGLRGRGGVAEGAEDTPRVTGKVKLRQ